MGIEKVFSAGPVAKYVTKDVSMLPPEEVARRRLVSFLEENPESGIAWVFYEKKGLFTTKVEDGLRMHDNDRISVARTINRHTWREGNRCRADRDHREDLYNPE